MIFLCILSFILLSMIVLFFISLKEAREIPKPKKHLNKRSRKDYYGF